MSPKTLLLLLLLAPLSACTGSGDDGGGAQAATADILLTDAPADDLLYLRAKVQGVVLEAPGGGLGANLLAAPVPVDLLSLDGVFEWLITGSISAGQVAAVRITFDPAAFEAADKDGDPVTVNVTSSLLRVAFPTPIDPDAGTYTRIEVDMDLIASLTGDVASGTVDLAPSGTIESSTGATGVAIDEIKGEVIAADAFLSTLTIDAYADGDLDAPLGSVAVEVSPTTLLLAEDGTEFADLAAFFTSLVADMTLLEVHGNLVGGVVEATKIEVEDAIGSGSLVVAELRGTVVDYAATVSFDLLIQEIKKGESIVLPVLTTLGNPASVTIEIDPGTLFFLSDDAATTEAALAVGQSVKVKFEAFSTEPFPAFKVEIEDADSEFEGFVADLGGLPTDFLVNLDDSDPAILAGLVESEATDVTVTVGSASVELSVDGDPALATDDLSTGLRMEIDGTLSGTPQAPDIAATKIQVFPGRLEDALVAALNAPSSTFMTSGGAISDPFGGGITEGPLDVVIEPGCVFDGAAETETAFFALTGTITVRVEGIASGNPDEIRAFKIVSEVE